MAEQPIVETSEPAVLIDGVPHIPTDEALALAADVSREDEELLARLAQ